MQVFDGSGVDEGGLLDDVEEPVAHLDLDAQLEPLVVDVEAGTRLSGAVEALGDQVVDELVAVDVGFLVVFLRSEVEFRVDTGKDIGSDVVVTLRAVLDVQRELYEGGADGFGDGLHVDVAVDAFDGDIVYHFTFTETQRGDETQVEIPTETLGAENAHGEAWRLTGLYVIDIHAFSVGDAIAAVGP